MAVNVEVNCFLKFAFTWDRPAYSQRKGRQMDKKSENVPSPRRQTEKCRVLDEWAKNVCERSQKRTKKAALVGGA